MVEMWEDTKDSSANLSRKQVLPTPESPIRMSLIKWSKPVFLLDIIEIGTKVAINGVLWLVVYSIKWKKLKIFIILRFDKKYNLSSIF